MSGSDAFFKDTLTITVKIVNFWTDVLFLRVIQYYDVHLT
jgi:hypothetical protein